ncbi:MAG: hypothetical protein BAJATHORv1_40085 [Candidatus Thorarchaeota archaeon]|nr:MAG: hypothetical protein BAJATHORv1_40085 [Candidatus Thorarchaeota archaeon]
MRELRSFLNKVLLVKRDLKYVYYSSREENKKADAKQLVVQAITIQKSIEKLLSLTSQSRLGRKLLEDRKAELLLKKWEKGLPRRVKDYKDKAKKLRSEHLRKFYDAILQYMDTILEELVSWTEDIQTLKDIPKVPKDR